LIVKVDSGSHLVEQPSADAGSDGRANNTVAATTNFDVNAPDLTLPNRALLNDSGGNYQASFQIFTPFNFVGAGTPIDVNYQVQNAGSGVASQPWSNQVWISRDNHLDGGDILLDTFTQTSNMLASSTLSILRPGLVIPINTPPGTYRLIVKLDSGNQVVEQPSVDGGSDGNTNNTVVSTVTFDVGAPDLTVPNRALLNDSGGNYQASFQIFTPVNFVGAGTPIDVNYQVQNNGSGVASQPWSNQVWISRDNHLDAGDILLDTFTQTSNMVGLASVGIIRAGLLIPADTAPGTYHLIVKLDSGNQVVEQPSVDGGSDGNTNNTVVSTVTFDVGAPDLTVPNRALLNDSGGNYQASFQITTSPPNVVGAGQLLDVTYRVQNAGLGVASQPWSNQVWISRDNHLDSGEHPAQHVHPDLQHGRLGEPRHHPAPDS